jgi:hypothetical protein
MIRNQLSMWVLTALAGAGLFSGCASFKPKPIRIETLRSSALVEQRDDVLVRARLLSRDEMERHFGTKLWKESIQPIWIEVQNKGDHPLWFLKLAVDRDYYPTQEAAYRSHRFAAPHSNARIDDYYRANELPMIHPPGSHSSGFVFAEYTPDAKAFNVELFGGETLHIFHFSQEVPGFKADFNKINRKPVYSEAELKEVTAQDLRRELEALPRCTTGANGRKEGDPLNIVMIGTFEVVLQALVRSGWHLAEPEGAGPYWKTFQAFLLGERYLTAPVSHLYALGRSQDLALQKPRHSIKQRNHMRLWQTPLRFGGAPVWLGQISRDTGVRFTPHTWHLSTHKIAPDVDEARAYLVSDLFTSQALQTIGWVKGVDAAAPDKPRKNLTGDPYYTDGLRTVLVLAAELVDVKKIQRFDWETPPLPPLDIRTLDTYQSR